MNEKITHQNNVIRNEENNMKYEWRKQEKDIYQQKKNLH